VYDEVMEVTQMDFGNKVKQLRKRKGYSQKELADRVGVDDRTIRNWEKGDNKPRSEQYRLLAQALECDASYLIEDSENQTNLENQVEKIRNEITTMFSGGEMAEEDMDTLMFAIQEAYVKAKQERNRIDQ
jgi:transcriptional regulator with XRE-family HTH domain